MRGEVDFAAACVERQHAGAGAAAPCRGAQRNGKKNGSGVSNNMISFSSLPLLPHLSPFPRPPPPPPKVRAFDDLDLEVDGAVMRTGREILLAEDSSQTVRLPREGEGGGADPSAGVPSGMEAASCTGGGVLGSSVGVSAGGGSAAVAAAAVSAVGVIPMAPHRRLRQAVLLAHKLLKKEGELESSQRQLAELQQR